MIPTTSFAENKSDKTTFTLNQVKKMMDESYFMGLYDGHVMNACAVYLMGKIDKELKIDLIELSRKMLYENASKPKSYELGTMETANETLRFIKNEPCFSEIE